jgi:hypothetical protein
MRTKIVPSKQKVLLKGWETVEFDFAKQVSGSTALNLAYIYDKG